jgi:hypothetical protein
MSSKSDSANVPLSHAELRAAWGFCRSAAIAAELFLWTRERGRAGRGALLLDGGLRLMTDGLARFDSAYIIDWPTIQHYSYTARPDISPEEKQLHAVAAATWTRWNEIIRFTEDIATFVSKQWWLLHGIEVPGPVDPENIPRCVGERLLAESERGPELTLDDFGYRSRAHIDDGTLLEDAWLKFRFRRIRAELYREALKKVPPPSPKKPSRPGAGSPRPDHPLWSLCSIDTRPAKRADILLDALLRSQDGLLTLDDIAKLGHGSSSEGPMSALRSAYECIVDRFPAAGDFVSTRSPGKAAKREPALLLRSEPRRRRAKPRPRRQK